ncbi:MAG TPA: glutamine--fructose-6-phosphate transaminase (isomerizing), partial [Candidatus Sabulitectum sp.]|nr:glutamine--fructose-6-phosphate transaminase (isomerizing) [Candidatus Sabulitectum sp.]
MCGIVGYVGHGKALDVLLSGLKRLEYRGYDSAGYSLQTDHSLLVRKCMGRVSDLEKMDAGDAAGATTGIAHTRWATHGEPSQVNAHPHSDSSGKISLVHNGIIENYKQIRNRLEKSGVEFESETDTEVLAKLVGTEYQRSGDLFTAVKDALNQVRGAYGIAVVSADQPSTLVAARYGSPLVVGVGDGENIVASDVAAIVSHTRNVIYLEEGEVVEITRRGISSNSSDPKMTRDRIQHVDWELSEIEKDGFDHYMLKEIHSQPESLRNAIRGRLDISEGTAHLGGLNMTESDMRGIRRIVITACGTSWHSGLIGKYVIENLARIPVDVEYAS